VKIYQSKLGGALAVLYLGLVATVAYDVAGCANHSFPLVCDFPLGLAVLPALPLSGLGLPEPAFRSPGPRAPDIALLCLYAGLCAALVYLVGYGVERAYRRVRARFRRAAHAAPPR
jgi:hypothetical protein